MQVLRTNDRSEVVVKVLIAVLLITLIIVYNKGFYNILNTIRWKRLKLSSSNNTTTTTGAPSNAEATSVGAASIPEGYLLWSDNCHIPSVDPYTYLEEFEYEMTSEFHTIPNCSLTEQLVTKLYNETLQSYVLHINYDRRDEYLNGTDDEDINCWYTRIFRDGDKGYAWSSCLQLEQDFLVPPDIDYMLIECNGTENAPTFYQDGISYFQDRDDVKERFERNSESPRPFGILMFGIDSVSQFNLRRTMPATFEYFQNNNWFELSGYNKVADNTFPNLMAVMSGADLNKVDEMCHYHDIGLDNCTTLFNLFRRQGLVTAYSEDDCEISTFDYLKPGFKDPPTDYYQRPLLLAIEERLPIEKMSGLYYCIGPRRYAEYVYDFGVEFAERFLGQSIFGLFWTNYAHNHWADPATMDERIVEYFNYMESRHIFDNNVVILFSDHGSRWGFLRTQKEGYFEERLPMFFISLPQWFQDQYPEMVQSLILNKNRLTSPYDLHVTLKQLALMSLGKNEPIDLPISCPTCQTLFKPVLENRTCQLAGIEDHWCTCTPFENLDRDSEEMKNLTQLVIDEMNNYLDDSAYADKCVPLELYRVLESNLKLDLHHDAHTIRIQEYRMSFVTNPNEAEFDATILYDTINKNISVDVIEISRLNRYAEDSACVDDNIVKKYCICKDSVKKNDT